MVYYSHQKVRDNYKVYIRCRSGETVEIVGA